MRPADVWLSAKIQARSTSRKLGVTRLIHRLSNTRREPGNLARYETKVDAVLRRHIRTSDTVWDVGANLGLYTTRFSDWVGPAGHVVAFEPVPSCFQRLSERIDGSSNVSTLNLALGDRKGQLSMRLAEDPHGATHTFLDVDRPSNETLDLPVRSGDELCREGRLPTPNVLKIDVEGFELEVLRGLDATLANAACRAIVLEVHFGLLEERGRKHAPRDLQQLLRDRSFQVDWVDASHLVAYRS